MKLCIPKINLSLQLAFVLLVAIFFGDAFSVTVRAFFYTLSLSLKEGLLVVLPAVVFSCIFNCMLAQKGRAFGFIAILVGSVCISNLIATFLAYGIAHLSFASLKISLSGHAVLQTEGLMPLWPLWSIKWLSNVQALVLGALFGSYAACFPSPRLNRWGQHLNSFVTFFLEKLFLPVLPVFAFGFILKMKHEGILQQIIDTYFPIILLIIVSNLVYLSGLYMAVSGFKGRVCLGYIKNILPAALMGFTTMSSMAALPVSVNAAEKNIKDVEMARAIVPATVNIHLIGDGIAIPLLAIAVLLTFGQSIPSVNQYSIFALFFILYKFGAAGMPGASILVMLPVLEDYLGFSPEMSALITSLYILFDPIITTANVLGNGVFTIFLSKIFKPQPQKVITV